MSDKTMKVSREMAEKARQALAFISDQCEKLAMNYGRDGGARINGSDYKKLNSALTHIGEFLNVAKRELPSEASRRGTTHKGDEQ